MAKWVCEEHDVEISVKEGDSEKVLREIPPKCPACDSPMKRELEGVTKSDLKEAVAEVVGLTEDEVAKDFWNGYNRSGDPFKKEGWRKLAEALYDDITELERGEDQR